MKKSKFVYFGTPIFSTYVLDELSRASYIPELIVTTPPKPSGRSGDLLPSPVRMWGEAKGIPVLDPVKLDAAFISNLQSQEFIFAVVAAYGKMIPEALLGAFPQGVLNVHPSLLPKFRGPTPVQTAILHGEETTGVSVILLDTEMDHGPILGQREIRIEKRNRVELDKILWHEGGRLLIEVLPKWLDGTLSAIPQNHSEATFTAKFKTSDGYVDSYLITTGCLRHPNQTCEDLLLAERKIRALNPDPGSYTEFFAKSRPIPVRVKILSAEIKENKLLPILVVPAGKKEMSWDTFLRGA